jgi:predicted PurR-regulated permease PerM
LASALVELAPGSGGGCSRTRFWLIRSFVVPLIRAAIFAIVNWPLYRRCAHHLPDALSARVLPLAFSVLVTFLVLGPVVFAFGIMAGQTQAWLTENLGVG